MSGPTVVIIGAGIVGCALADELTGRGWTGVTVLDRGPLFETGGSSSHAPGLVFQTNPSRTMSRLARYTVEKYSELGCFSPVGSLEVATTAARLAELHRRFGFGQSWGVPSSVLDPAACATLYPLLDKSLIVGGLHVPSDGLVPTVRAAEAQAARATARGARFLGDMTVTRVLSRAGRVTGVATADEEFPADLVVSCAGLWGPAIGALAGVSIPLLPMAHQYVRTTPAGAADSLPILRHQDRDLYFRAHGDRFGIGSYRHEPMPVDLADLPGDAHPSKLPFTPDTFRQSWTAAGELIPALRGATLEEAFNGVFSFTADGFPLLGEAAALRGFWVAEAVWVTHSAGAAKAVAEWMVDGRPAIDLHECDLNRFDAAQLAPDYVRRRAIRNFVEVYDIVHPADPPPVRNVRVSPFHPRQTELGAVFGEAAGWERPLWYATNPPPEAPRPRDEWSARHWSPIAETEARLTRRRVALYDMTPLTRIDVTGPVSFLSGLVADDVDRPVGTVVYTFLPDRAGGVRSDVTVARLGEDRFRVGGNGPLDVDWLRRHAPPGVSVRDVTGGTCGVGLWGPAARELVAPLTDVDVSAEAFRYFRAREGHLGTVPVTMLRLSYVGELGWEIYTEAQYGLRLWDTLWEAGREHGLIVAGRLAFDSLRLEKGYRAWGRDMTGEDDPYQAGLRPFGEQPPDRRLTCLVLADTGDVPLGREPVYAGGFPVGHVTSAAYGWSVGAPIAYAWLPSALALPGTQVEIGYFDRLLLATVAAEPLFDPKHERLRR
ncbi:FAD-dependent oxidoreductase [Actinoplanes sichuanensis]|uniref:FAD-dependent oxidoreductase n=1 Tax=Actinoplanes sichuanensis TaxID=512349 RepID=A0ABW4AH71_9ACTN|nr:FAD-dependent oxidoreductase [Actinoplanes sichuanensis]BEL12137.1 FAD-dependent oxidoreductase [Actinoplanes sichuanensis]